MWLLALLGVFLLCASSVGAADFTCSAGDVPCLVGAIGKANSQRTSRHTITLPAGTWTLTQLDTTDTEGATGLPTITSRVTIAGQGAGQTIIERADDAPLFRLFQVAPEGALTLQDLTLQGGEVDIDFLERGGGIRNLGSLIIQDSVLTEHKAWVGGAIENRGTLLLQRSALTDNFADFVGAGLALIGPARIERSVLLDNIAEGEAGIAFDPGAGTILVRRSLISGNMATLSSGGGGGGVGTLILEDTALVDNSSGLHGGGLALDNGSLTLLGSVVAGNVAEVSGGGLLISRGELRLDRTSVVGNRTLFGAGGGIANQDGAVLVERSALLGNLAGQGQGPDCTGRITVRAQTLLGDRAGCTVEGEPSDGAPLAQR